MSSRVLPGTDRRPAILLAALGAAALAAVLLAAGAVVPVVDGAEPGFASAPLLIVLALLPLVLAGAFMMRGRSSVAAGVLVAAAALAPGRAVLDLQFLVDASVAVRPELYLATDLLSHPATTGLWLLLAGHVLTAVAGVVAFRVTRAAGEQDGSDDDAVRWRQRWLLVVVVAAVVAGIGLLMAPFGSTDVYLLARNAFEGPAVALAGSLLIACALPLLAALAVTSGNGGFARGGLIGLAAAVFVLAVPGLVAGLAVGAASLGAGPIVALVGAAVLLAVAGTRPDSGEDTDEGPDAAGEASVPGRGMLFAATGGLAVLTAVTAGLGATTAQLSNTGAFPVPESPARWVLLVAGLLVGVLGLAMFVPAVASLLRPVLSVAWAGVLIAGTAVLDTAITATGIPGALETGPGVLWTWLAMFGAAVTACCSMVAGVVEREDDETFGGDGGDSELAGMNMLTPLAAAAVLAVAAFGTPVIVAPDYAAAGLWSDFGTPSWGLLAGALTVLGAVALAPRSRPVPAAALLGGAACLLGVHAATLPLSSGDIDGAGAGIGVWFALAGIVALVIAAGIALSGRSRETA
ncbi:hypothetical protein [Prauserella cavernicola]|uniref:Uncharacterized protein n=1 Tax=Prauserella cavernicola TaxID=2800127 RepID=A0A934V9Z5_9PSEU|nr:hypothetical protein [Prauserella cavernicola]MBK1789373.1 hypothetical protein [Prauserella cavernicola]